MKIKPEHYQVIEKWLVLAVQESYTLEQWLKALENKPEEKAKIKNVYRSHLFYLQWYCWDMFWFAKKLSLRESCEFMQVLDAVYLYADDSHVETVIKKILNIKF